MNIQIISGTNRPNSNALRVSTYLQKQYSAQGVSAKISDLRDFPYADILEGTHDPKIPSVSAFIEPIIQADGLVFVVPEYNGSFPGVLKVMIDHLPFPAAFEHQPIAFVGEAAGAFGNLRGVEHLQMVCNYRNARIFPERVFIQRIHKNWSDESGILDEFGNKLLHQQIERFVEFVKVNKR